jgi:NAD(P)-dependent dehydrogenase (short-subunit alcohol dehydrogenase family)
VIPLAGRTALVTGAAKRLGRAIATALAAEGVHVVVHYRSSRQEAESLCAALSTIGARAFAVHADLGDPAQAALLVERASALAGPLDILVNNASVFPADTLAELSFPRLADTLRSNAWAPFVLARSLAQQTQRGDVIQLLDTRIGSVDLRHASYLLSKELLAVLTRMLALDLAPGIRVNAVAPGPMLPPPGGTERDLAPLGAATPLRRVGRPADIANAVLMLLRSDYITGEIVHVDGGAHLRHG